MQNNKKLAKKLLVLDITFVGIDFIITYVMFRLWFWLFDNKIILIILIVITLFGLIKQLWKAVDNITKHVRMLINNVDDTNSNSSDTHQ